MKNRCFNNFSVNYEAKRFRSVRTCHTLILHVLPCQRRGKKRQTILPLDKLNFLSKYPKIPDIRNRKVNCWKISRERNKNNLVKLHIRFVQRRETSLLFTPYFNIHSKRKTYLKRGATKTFFHHRTKETSVNDNDDRKVSKKFP